MKNKVIFLLLLTMVVSLNAQQKPTYEKKTYISPDGKLYINKALPLYLWLSTSPNDDSKKYRLKSEQTPEYSNPMYLDTDGWNSVRSPSAVDPETRKPIYPLRDIVFEIYADPGAPETKTDFGESRPFVHEGKSYVRENTKLELKSRDDYSGVEGIYFSINGTPFSKYAEPINFTEEKEYNLKYYAVDNVGNVEETNEISIIYDKTAPKTRRNITTDEHESIISSRSKIELTSEDSGIGVKTIYFKIDDGNEYPYKYPISASILSQGEHTVEYYATDKVGNQENIQTYSFYVDKTPPTIIEEVIAKTFFANGKEYASGKAQLKLTAFDNKAGIKEIKYSINGGEYQVYDKPVFLTQSAGSLVIKTYAVDNVNNKSQSQAANEKTTIPYIDLSGPNLSHSFSGPVFSTRDTVFINSKTKISLKAADKEAGISRIEYRINGKENFSYDKPFSIEKEGIHTITYVGYDNVENTSSNSFVVKVDNQGPEIHYNFSIKPEGATGSLNNYPKHVILYLSGTDSEIGVEKINYGFRDTADRLYTSPVSGFALGEKKMIISAVDMLGNTSRKEIDFNIE